MCVGEFRVILMGSNVCLLNMVLRLEEELLDECVDDLGGRVGCLWCVFIGVGGFQGGCV